MRREPNNSVLTAKTIRSNIQLRDSVGSRRDKFDFFRFKLNHRSSVQISLSNLQKNADLVVFDSDRKVINQSKLPGKCKEQINTILEAGTYVVKIVAKKSTQYRLKLTSEKKPWNSLYGDGLVDAAKAVATAINQAPFLDVTDSSSPVQWSVDAVKAPEAWAKGFTGKDVVVAVLDSGVDYFNPLLSDSLWTNPGEIAFDGIDNDGNGYVDDVRGWDFVYNDNSPFDIDGHGTFVAGVITDRDIGIAPDAKVMPVKVSEDYYSTGSSFAFDSDIAKGIRYAVQNGADIINISLGGISETQPTLKQAIRFARQQGVLVVIAAGNDRQLGLRQPLNPAWFAASNNYGIAVGAVNRNQKFAPFSNPAGNKPIDYVVAPGVNVYSTSYESGAAPYEIVSGTSFSTPAVAAIAALMLSANPNLTPEQIEDILTSTAQPL